MAQPWTLRLAALERWLRDHHDMVTTDEGGRLGFSPQAMHRLARDGRLARVQRNLFVRGPGLSGPEQRLRVAVHAGGTGTAASHLSAGWWLGLLDQPPTQPHINVRPDRRARLPGVRVHQSEVAGETRSVRDLVVTTPERTVLDLASRPDITVARLEAVVDRALMDALTTPDRLVAITTGGARRRRGSPRLRLVLEGRGHLGMPGASVLEERAAGLLARLARQHGIERPVAEHEQWGGRYRLDFAWPRLLLAVEVDGYVWHAGSADMARDLARRNELMGAGWTVLVFTWHQVVHDPAGFCDQVLAAYRRAEGRRA